MIELTANRTADQQTPALCSAHTRDAEHADAQYQTSRCITQAVALLFTCWLVACSGPDNPASDATEIPPVDDPTTFQHPDAQAYYAQHPEFFTFATPADLPPDLQWQDGSEQAEFASLEAQKGGEVRIWIPDFPRTLRFVGPDSNGSFRRYILDENGMTLLHKHPNTGAYYPGLAQAWAVADSGDTLFFKLDPDATYSDGVPVRSGDFFFMFYFMRSPHIVAPWYQDYYSRKFSNITKYDDLTFSFTVTEMKPDILRYAEQRPVPRHFYANFGADYVQRYQWQFEPTTGPYTIRESGLKKGRSITQTRVRDWWAKDKKFWRYRFNPDERTFIVIRDPNKAMESFKRGDIDYCRLDLPQDWYEKVPNDLPDVRNGYIHKAQFYNDVPRPNFALWINKAHKPLADRRIRQGIHYAMNWDRIIDVYFRGDYTRMHTTATGYGQFSHPTLRARPFSVEKARALFAEAGYNQVDTDGILKNTAGQRLSITLTSGYRQYADALNILQQEAAKAGLELQLELLDKTTAIKKAMEKKHAITFAGFNLSVELYPRYWDFWHSYNAVDENGSIKPQTNNLTSTHNPQLDALIEAYDAAQDPATIQRLAHEIEEWLYEDAAFVPTFIRPWYRTGYWRWVQWPAGFNVKLSKYAEEYNLYWIDPASKATTLKARKNEQPLSNGVHVYDTYKRPKPQ